MVFLEKVSGLRAGAGDVETVRGGAAALISLNYKTDNRRREHLDTVTATQFHLTNLFAGQNVAARQSSHKFTLLDQNKRDHIVLRRAGDPRLLCCADLRAAARILLSTVFSRSDGRHSGAGQFFSSIIILPPPPSCSSQSRLPRSTGLFSSLPC